MNFKQLAAAIAMAPLAMVASAEVTFTPLVGAHYFDENTNDKTTGSGGPSPEQWQLRYGGSLGYRFTDAFGVEVEAGRTEGELDSAAANDTRTTQVVGNAYYTFNTSGMFQPYLLAGAGEQRYKIKGTSVASRDTIYNAGIGAFFRFTDTLALRTELRAVHNHDHSLTDGLALVGLEFSPANARPVVEAAPQPEPVQEAPVAVDSDGDGVADHLDKCPNTPAGMRVDASGCPIDSDGDGVPDSIDQCPNTPSGVQVNAQGCPLDQDGDGVPDHLDKCPNTPAGAIVDADGCPKVLTEAISREVKVLFDSGKAVIKPEFRSEVEEVAKLLRQYPTAHAEIQGHTDSSGSLALNNRLSQQRADAVRNMLVQDFGVDASRVDAKGYGPSQPVASNATAEGKAQNRRVIAVITGERKKLQMQQKR